MAEQRRPPNPFARNKNRAPLDLYEIHSRGPGVFQVLRFSQIGDQKIQATERACLNAGSLEEARTLIPKGLFCTTREAEDEPSLMETWL